MARNILHWAGAFLLLAAMALLIVASVSSPIWDSQGFLHGTVNGQSFTAGNWGYIVNGMKSGSKLGYDTNRFNTLAGNPSSDIFLHGLSMTLILTPICAGLSFLALLFALSTHLVMGILASALALLAFIATAVSLGLDLGLFVVARHRINNLNNSHAKFGAMIWLVVAACACQLLAAMMVCFTRNRNRRAADDREFASVPAMRGTETPVALSTVGSPSVVGSTHPMMHDTMHEQRNTYHNGNNNDGLTEVNEYHTPGTGAYQATGQTVPGEAVPTSGHFWQRGKTETY